MKKRLVASVVVGFIVGVVWSMPVAAKTEGCPRGCCAELNQVCGNDCTVCVLPQQGEAPCAPGDCGNYCWDPCGPIGGR